MTSPRVRSTISRHATGLQVTTSAPPRAPSRPRLDVFWPATAAVAVAHLALASYRIGSRPLWADEAYTAVAVREPFGDLLHLLTRREANGALHYVALWVWSRLIGTSELQLRSMSLILGALAVVGTALIARELLGTRGGITAAVVFAFLPSVLEQGQTARTGSLTMALAVGSVAAFVAACRRPTRWRLAAWAVASVLVCYAHFFGLLLVAGQAATAIAHPPYRAKLRAHLAGVIAAVAAFVIFVAPLVLFMATRDVGQIDWVPPLSVDLLNGVSAELLGSRIGVAVTAGVVLAGVVRLRRAPNGRHAEALALALPWVLLPAAVAVVVSLLKPVLVGRYLVLVLPGVAVLFAAVLDRVRAVLAAGLVALVLVRALTNSPRWYDRLVEDYPAAVAIVEERAAISPVAVAATSTWSMVGMMYYLGTPPPAVSDHVRALRFEDDEPELWVVIRVDLTTSSERWKVEVDGRRIRPVETRRVRGLVLERYETGGPFTFSSARR